MTGDIMIQNCDIPPYIHVHESWYHQRSLTHHSQFSRLGIQCPTLIYVEWVNEVGFFLNFLVWLVCYAHVFHV